jgi:prepilin-type N-terminal cleavage/methylation domain-containing protein
VKRRGFTLLEVLVAIALISMLLGSLFAFLHDLLQSRSRALDYTAHQLAAATLIGRVEAELASCIVGDDTSGPGVKGDAASLSILSRGVAVHLAEDGLESGVLGDLQQSEYRFVDEAGEIEVRRMTPWAQPAPDFVSIGPVYRLRFRFHDGTAWSDSFDSLAEGRLPQAVEVAVWYHRWPGEQETQPEALAERLTFDTTGGFDDAAFAQQSDIELFDEPRPDRFRVIVIPDASSEDPFAPADVELLP